MSTQKVAVAAHAKLCMRSLTLNKKEQQQQLRVLAVLVEMA